MVSPGHWHRDVLSAGSLQVQAKGRNISVVEQLGIVIRIWRCATTKDLERSIAGVLHTVRRARVDAHRIAGLNRKYFITQGHETLAVGEVIKLFCLRMPVQARCCPDSHRRFGQALRLIAVRAGVHELANERAVERDVGQGLGVLHLAYHRAAQS